MYFKADGPATAVCRDDAVCKVEVGEGGSAVCLDNAECDFKCVGGSCAIECDTTGLCSLDCGSDETEVDCGDGRQVCGSC